MENITSTAKRIKELIDYKKVSLNKFSSKIGTSNSYFNKMIKNEGVIGSDKIEKILRVYPDVSPDWLLTGRGAMLRGTSLPRESHVLGDGFPLVRQEAIGGFGGADFAIAEQDVKARYVIPDFKPLKPDFMIRVQGSSMYPKYSSGDVVACRVIRERGFIQWNKTHVVATREQGILIKRIHEGTDKDMLVMVSDHKDYDPFPVPRTDITGLALVVGVIRLE